jgi:hypothetical protein
MLVSWCFQNENVKREVRMDYIKVFVIPSIIGWIIYLAWYSIPTALLFCAFVVAVLAYDNND